MIYRFRGIDQKGTKLRETIEASSLAEAKSKLKARGILYTEITEETPSWTQRLRFFRTSSISARELADLSRELAMYIRSGISIVQALKIAANHYTSDRKLSLFLSEVNTLLDEGENFYSALSKQQVLRLPEFYKQSIKVSENGGILDEVLLELSSFLKEQDRLHKEIRRAFAYPVFMIFVSLVMIAFMLTFVVPQITSIFVDLHQELPTPTKIVIALGNFFQAHYIAVFTAAATAAIFFVILKKRSRRFAGAVDTAVLRLPFFGPLVQKSELARFSYMASLLTRSGIPFVQTINLSASILKNGVIRDIFEDASTEVVEGKPLSVSLQRGSYRLDTAFLQAIALAEETSEVEAVLANIAELYFEENRDKTALLLTLLEPALMLFVGGTIGFIVAAMLLPIFSMSIQ